MIRFGSKMKDIKFLFSSEQSYSAILDRYYKKNDLLEGWCTAEKSLKYSLRSSEVHKNNWKRPTNLNEELYLSSIGVGTMNGEATGEGDNEMFEGLIKSLTSNCMNVIDTDSHYRFGKSEKVINAALNYLIKEKSYSRQQFFISSKCGFIPHDIDSNLKEEDFIKILTSQKFINPEDIVQGIHCVHPNYIEFSLQKSLISLGLETIDLFYLNNFSEAQMPIIGQKLFYERMHSAFEKMEELRATNKIKYYGIASYVGLRSPPNEEKIHLSFQKVIEIAKKVGGHQHGLRFTMIPLSLGTPQSILKWQHYTTNQSEDKLLNIFQIASLQKINIMACSPLFQGRIVNVPFQSLKMNNLKTNSAKHLQLIRSYYSPALVCTLVGQNNTAHVQSNLEVFKHDLLTEQEWKAILPLPA